MILDLSRKARVTESKDKVYGLLGILPEPLATAISPDYKLSKEQVYSQFARAMLHESKRMDSIFSWCSFKDESSCPSWIPDWTTEFPRNRVHWLRIRKASGSAPAAWSVSKDGSRLHSKGFMVDKVEETSASPTESIPYRTEMPRESGHSHLLRCPNRYGSRKSLSAALRRTLTIYDHGRGCWGQEQSRNCSVTTLLPTWQTLQ